MTRLSKLKQSTRLVLLALFAVPFLLVTLHLGRMVLAPSRDASIDAVRVRNALVIELGLPSETNWPPSAVPSAFNWESRIAPEPFVEVVESVLRDSPDGITDFEKALLLSRHVRLNAREGRPIQANAWLTYQKLTSGQGGYCSDFTQTINALGLAAGLQVREWGFAWESFANGHAFNEIWEPSLQKWVLLDSHHGFYVVDSASGVPLSALEFRDHLMTEADPASVRLVPISEETFDERRIGNERAFYASGAPRFFLLMGNNVYSYDAHPLVQITEDLPRSIEMLTAILLGEHPRFLYVPPIERPDLKQEVEAMAWIRHRTLIEIALGAVTGLAIVLLLLSFLTSDRSKRREPEVSRRPV